MRVNRHLVVLVIVAFLLAGSNVMFTAYWVNHTRAAAQRAGQVVEQKLCSTFGRLAALKPPPGNPATNPSRAYLQAEHATLVQLGADIHCEGPR